jgi:pyruvate/2-oxoglutarate dehydrogenase complex dihydrolipoamide acyltransferase (E2) component
MPIISQNIEFGAPLKLSPWRRTAIAMWKTAKDPSVYGFIDLECEAVLRYIEKLKVKHGTRITLTHFAGRAIGEMLTRHPELNTTLRWGTLYPRKNVDLTFTVASDTTGKDLSSYTIRQAQNKGVLDIARELGQEVPLIRSMQDPSHRVFKKIVAAMPPFLAGPAISLASFILFTLNLWTPLFGLPRDGFGSVLVTNVGSLGLDTAFGALVPAVRIPMIISVCAMKEMPVVRNSQVVAAPVLRLCLTVDHRVIDAVPAAKMAKTLRQIFADPEKELGLR